MLDRCALTELTCNVPQSVESAVVRVPRLGQRGVLRGTGTFEVERSQAWTRRASRYDRIVYGFESAYVATAQHHLCALRRGRDRECPTDAGACARNQDDTARQGRALRACAVRGGRLVHAC